MLVSVIICTRNRANSLGRTLNSIAQMILPSGFEWELIVVDNGSTDHTREVLGRFKSTLPVRVIEETVPGLSNARNAGIRDAKGRYIVWTDDDAIVGSNWLGAYITAFRQWPDAAVFGGRIVPVLEGSFPPRWFADNLDILEGIVSRRDFGDQVLPLSIPLRRIPYGVNYAVRATEQRSRLYDKNLGLAPGRSRRGEEEQVLSAILNSGATGYYIPESVVEHFIPVSMQTESYVFSWYRGQGATFAHMEYGGKSAGRGLFGVPRWLWRVLAKDWAKYLVARAFTRPRWWIPTFIEYARRRGAIDYFRTLNRTA